MSTILVVLALTTWPLALAYGVSYGRRKGREAAEVDIAIQIAEAKTEAIVELTQEIEEEKAALRARLAPPEPTEEVKAIVDLAERISAFPAGTIMHVLQGPDGRVLH